ncbi:hypothetical protein FOMPIDRAFT_1045563 [Fomitopsis schrenkii]|uniref:Uncharacterized protein n=1 Tax=Fomitopsis schrenkii TaxID=2126942 RepID=S8G3N2_FOMSC|nr:hypothetical protein FOMPIDRAFT_1045563 [Fomitopsis schrenkii]
MQKMVDLIQLTVSAQCFSGCWQDEAGKTLAVYWAYHKKNNKAADNKPQPLHSQYLDRDENVMRSMQKEDVEYIGLRPKPQEADVETVLIATQFLTSKHYSTYHERDGCHNLKLIPGLKNGKIINLDAAINPHEKKLYEDQEEDVNPEQELKNQERTGVLHLVEAWVPQGHKNGNLIPSADLTPPCEKAIHLKHYYKMTKSVVEKLGLMFKHGA